MLFHLGTMRPTFFLSKLFHATLNSVPFGIGLMVLTALYIAIGSGLTGLREWLEMNELQFFSAWPLKVLMGLLVLNLATVTWLRIPFTPPRWGVWCIHTGIIILVIGVSSYYSQKVEGLTLIRKGETIDHFYDTFERAMYVRVGSRTSEPLAMPSMPRFKSYSRELGNTRRLDRRDLRNVAPQFLTFDFDSNMVALRSLGKEIGLDRELYLDVLEYFPYAEIQTEHRLLASGGTRGVRLEFRDPHEHTAREKWVLARSDDDGQTLLVDASFEHRHLDNAEDAENVVRFAGRIHRLEVKVGEALHTLFVELGQTYAVGDSGYWILIERFDPSWPTMQGEIVPALTMKITTPGTSGPVQFRRMVLDARRVQTDFLLDQPGAGPMGVRQAEPADKNIHIDYRVSDPLNLLPRQARNKHTIFTAGDDRIVYVVTGFSRPTTVADIRGKQGQIQLPPLVPDPMMPHQHQGDHADEAPIKVTRHDHIERIERIVDIPPHLRDRNIGATGNMQVVTVRLRAGDWQRELAVPFTPYAGQFAWPTQEIRIPGAQHAFQMTLGNTRRPIGNVSGRPLLRVTLDDFELMPYMGGDNTLASIMRDFKSHLTVLDLQTMQAVQGVAHMNNPMYLTVRTPWFLPNQSWLLFQAQWDPEGQRHTVLGVGNRPAVGVMTVGCVMIVLGLLYAFYVKPIIIRRMKQNALERASQRNASPRRALVATDEHR